MWLADLAEPRESEPGFRRPVLIVQADAFNRSRLRTVIRRFMGQVENGLRLVLGL
ncbi:MAG: type II toxin-antitoxin system PemK/MazF family toxin [Gemmatimonadota bacterium]|nr:type II toxin-antitoxin system PemK/MazF family toxin [Gemmatimonadota bacterium]